VASYSLVDEGGSAVLWEVEAVVKESLVGHETGRMSAISPPYASWSEGGWGWGSLDEEACEQRCPKEEKGGGPVRG
jgi:hypothetical protein